MDRGSAFALTVASSALIAAQAPINSHLGRAIGTFQAAFVSFAVGAAALAVIAIFTGGLAFDLGSVRWYYLTGGLMGAVFVTTLLVTVRTLGAAGILAAGLVGQMTASVAIDYFGWFGVARAPITTTRISGILLVAVGAWLVIRH
jgi:bacterial/archaeal transporter family-2 protein